MSHEYSFYDSRRVVFVRFFDSVDAEDIQQFMQSLLTDLRALNNARILCEVSNSIPDAIHAPQMQTVVSFINDRIDAFSGMKWATVSSSLLNFGISRMAGELSKLLPIEYQTFSSLSLACNWLAVPPSIIASVEDQLLANSSHARSESCQ